MYRDNIHHLRLFFQGKKKKLIQHLKKEMKAVAKERKFELAANLRNQVFALDHINDVSLLKLEPKTHNLQPGFRIEAYDIAHMSGKNIVGVMTVVENGMVQKSEYKKFRIRTQSGANDTGALTEVLERRLKHQEWGYPNLIVLDGGVAQLNAAKAILHRLDLQIEAVAVVKDERHRPKAVMGDEATVRKYKSSILLANSEAHRFAIAYHKNRRAKSFLGETRRRRTF